MPKSFQRSEQVADLIRHEVTHFLQREIRDPRLTSISITHVAVSPDLGLAKIFYTFLTVIDVNDPQIKEIQKALNKAAGYLRHLLSQNVKMRYVPELMFIFDDTLLKAERIQQLIDQVTAEDDKRKK